MKEKSFFSRLFGGGAEKAAEQRVETRKSETTQTETGTPANSSDDEAKRNADFWNMTHGRMGEAHLAAGKMWMKSCGMMEAADREAFSKALNFMRLIIGTDGEMERAKEKFHTDDMFQIFRMLKFDDIML